MQHQKPLIGRLYQNATGQKTYGIDGVEPEFLLKVAPVLVVEFGLVKQGESVYGLDVILMRFSSPDGEIGLEWDIWTGCSLRALAPSADELIVKIAESLDSRLNEL